MVARERFELSTLWLKVKCSTDWASEPKDGCLGWVRTSGMSESKSDALPLGYEAKLKWWGDMDLNHGTRRNRFTVCRVWPLRYLPIQMVPTEGVEPPTYWLQVSCAASYAMSAKNGGRYRTRTYDPLLVRQVL